MTGTMVNSGGTNVISAQLSPVGKCLLSIAGYNSLAATTFVMLYDTSVATIPANGTTPNFIVPVGATNGFFENFGSDGVIFQNGIMAVASTTAPTLTAAATVIFFEAVVILVTELYHRLD